MIDSQRQVTTKLLLIKKSVTPNCKLWHANNEVVKVSNTRDRSSLPSENFMFHNTAGADLWVYHERLVKPNFTRSINCVANKMKNKLEFYH